MVCGQTPTEKVSAKALYPPSGGSGGASGDGAGASGTEPERRQSGDKTRSGARAEVRSWRGTEQPLLNEH